MYLAFFALENNWRSDNLFRLATEVWDIESSTDNIIAGKDIQPRLADGNYRYGIGLYAVDFDFCRK